MNHTPTGSPNNGAPRTIIVVFTCLSLLLFATTHPTTTPAPAVAPVTPASTTDAAPKSAEPATEKVATDNADTSDGTNPPSDAQAEMAMVDGTDPNEKPVSYMATAHTDNVAAFDPSESDNAIVPAVALPAPEPDTGPAPITAEESAAKVEAAKAEKKTILAAAQKNETEKTTAVKKDTDLFAYNLTGLKEAGVDISKNGFGMTAKMSLGWGAYLRATFAVNTEGLLLQAYMKEINVANLIKITGVGPDGKYGTADDGVLAEIRLDKKVQKVTLSGLVDLFGAMAEIDLIIASETIHLMTYANLFGMFSTTFLAEFKLNDGDFFLEGAVENNFIGFIEKEAKAAVTKVGDALVNVYKKAEKGIENARKKVDGLKHDISNLSAKLKHAQAAYFAAMNGAQKGIDSAVKAVEEADRNLGHELGKILAARKKMLEGRKKIAAAVTKVNSLNSEVHHAIASLKRVARGMKWYEFWKVAELTYWSVRVAAVETARGVAIGVLETVKALVLPLSEILTVTYALSYAAGEVALKASYVGLEAALVAANPLTIEELAEVLAFSLALNTTKLSYYVAQGTLITAWAAFKANEEITKGLTIAVKGIITAAFEVFRIDGAAFRCSIKNVVQGSLDLFLLIHLFGVKKNLKLVLDLTHPERTLASFGNMIADIFNPLSHGSKDDIFAKIAEHRKAFLSDLTALEVKKNTTVVEQTGIKKQLRDRDDALKKIQAENAQRLAAMRQKFPFTAEDIKSMGTIDFLTPDETASIVDEKDPVSYTVNNMKNTFRWIEKWKLPEADSGSVIFDVAGDREIHIAFHHEVHEKEQVHNKDFDILLGTKQNSINVIRDQNNVVLFSSGDPNGLVLQKKDGGFQTYWASFNKGYVSVGRGATPGKELLFDWNVPNLPEKIQYFSFSSQDNQLAFVNIHTGPPSTQAFGSQYSSYNAYNQFSWPLKLPALNNGTITFTAKASQHIAIGLSDNPHATFARYLAAIGAEGNSKATMATSAPDGKTYNYLAISQDPDATLSDSSNKTYHPYWATFNNGHFVIGSGTNPSKNIISEMYADPATMAPSVIVNILAEAPPSSTAPAHSAAPAEHHDTPATPIDPAKKPTEGGGGCPIQYVSFSSWDNPVEIRDIVIQPAVACPIGTMASAVNRHFACTWNETWALPTAGKGIVTWHGKGASDMCLALHTNGTSTDNSYTLLCTIGAEKNTKTTLSDHTKKVISETTDTEAIIAAKSSYTPYWFAYDEDGYCMLGTGTTPGNDVILETPTDKQPLTHFCFTNNTDHVEFNSIAALPLDKPLRRGTQFTAGPQTPLTWRSSWTLPNTDDLLLIFAAKTQFGFSVGLQTDAKEIYTLVVGDAGGTKTTVADDKGAILVTTENKATYITDPFNFYPYWVHYNKATGALAYGHGPVTQKDIIGQTTLPAKPAFTSFAIGNQTQASLYCKKIAALDPKDPIIVTEYGDALLAEAYTTHTPQPTATYVWEEAWKLHKPDAGIMTLNARSSGTLCIGIGNQKSGAVYEVFINGKEATVRKNKTVVARSTDSDALLPDGDNFYGFWISYHKGHLTVGRNSDPHKNTVLEWLDREPAKEITHFALASANGDATYQDTTQLPGNAMPAYQTYSACQEKGVFNWLSPWALAKPEQGLITFEVKTDSEAVIGLTGTKAEPTYVIKIGKNCTITQNGVLVATSELGSQPLVSKEDFQAFWIVFDKGYIAVGQGTTQNNDSLLADYQNINVVDIMQRFSVSSSTGQATYRTIESQRSSTSVLKRNTSFSANMRKGTYTFSDKWKLSANSAGSIVFDVQGDGPYYFGLDNKLATLANPLFEVIIGANKNTGAQIKKQGNIVESITDARGVVSVPSHASTYWVIFNEDHISVGAGNKPGVKTFLDWKDSMSSEATYFSFSSDASNVRYSNIQNLPVAKQEKVDQYVIPANRGKYKFDQTWRLLQSDFGGIVLKARGANDLCIGLHNSTGGTPLYEVVIGADKNSRTVIKSNGSVVAAIDSANAVIKNQYVPAFYWVLYDHGSVCVGLGDKPGTNILLFWHDDTIEADRGIIYYALAANDQMITVEQMASVKGISWPVNSIYNSYNKQGVFTWNPHWKLKMGQTLTCDVTASNGEVYIGLNNIPSMMPRYAVILGGWKNTKSVIMDKDTVAGKFDVTVKPITKSLWITYQNNTISVGTGDPHSKELFSWNNPKPDSPDTVAYFALSSGSTNVLYENITVIDAQAITSPKANKKVAGIQIATAPKEEPPVTDPSDPRYLPPTIAALMKATPEEAVATTASTGVAVPSTTAAAPAAEAKRPVPESSADFLKSLNPGDFVTVATPSSTIKTAPPTANDAPLSDDQQVVADVTAIFSDDAPSSNTPADTPKSPQAAIAA